MRSRRDKEVGDAALRLQRFEGSRFVLIIGDPNRFANGKKLSSYLGLVPAEESSGDRRRLGHISKQGNSLLRCLLGEAAQATVRCDTEWRRQFVHLAMRRQRAIAKVAMARKLAVSLFWMWREGANYGQRVRRTLMTSAPIATCWRTLARASSGPSYSTKYGSI
jgi:transposase